MAQEFSVVIRGGEVVDGRGAEPRRADVGIIGGKIAAVGEIAGRGKEEIDARGMLVTPGFIDPHTHFDAQLTWSERATPSSWNGVTTVMMGNCGVGFAPCRPEERETLVELMEGVEDIPGTVLKQGLPWNWQSFPEYLDALAARHYDADVAAQLPHAALRVSVMGKRGVKREPAAPAELEQMRKIVAESVRAGAFGVSTSRTRGHISVDGQLIPTFGAAEEELKAVGMGLKDAGAGWLQLISDFDDLQPEFAMLRRVAEHIRRPLSISLLQRVTLPDEWRKVLALIEDANTSAVPMYAQVIPRATGVLLGFELSQNPFMARPSYKRIAGLPFEERIAALRDPAFRKQILSESMPFNPNDAEDLGLRIAKWDRLFPLAEPLDYEPSEADSIAARAERAGVPPDHIAYDFLLERNGRAVLYRPFSNYGYGNLDAVQNMISHPNTLIGLGDAGAHVGGITDASSISFLLTYWTRDRKRGARFSIGWAVKRLSADTAFAMGLHDRGVIEPGYKADLNVIDYGRMKLRAPQVLYDLPGGGRRVVQKIDGYVATLVSGVPVYRDNEPTGALPGRLVRGAQTART